VKRIEEKESIKGGIIIPDSAKEKQQEGEVIAVGGGKREKGELVPLDVKVGDRVLFGKYSGTEIKIDDEDLLSCARKKSWRSSARPRPPARSNARRPSRGLSSEARR
jgi:chaperonin GroES